jgi:hypothetical protein
LIVHIQSIQNDAGGKDSFLRAMETRKDDVYSKVLKELTSLSDKKLSSTVVKSHKPCYRAYTSKQNLKPFLQMTVNCTKLKQRREHSGYCAGLKPKFPGV